MSAGNAYAVHLDRRWTKAQLLDACQALQDRVGDNVVEQPLGYVDESEDRVVDYLAILHNKFMSNTETQRHGEFMISIKILCLCASVFLITIYSSIVRPSAPAPSWPLCQPLRQSAQSCLHR